MDHLEVVGAGVADGRAEFEHDHARRTQAGATRCDRFGCLNPAPFSSEQYSFEPDSTLEFSYTV